MTLRRAARAPRARDPAPGPSSEPGGRPRVHEWPLSRRHRRLPGAGPPLVPTGPGFDSVRVLAPADGPSLESSRLANPAPPPAPPLPRRRPAAAIPRVQPRARPGTRPPGRPGDPAGAAISAPRARRRSATSESLECGTLWPLGLLSLVGGGAVLSVHGRPGCRSSALQKQEGGCSSAPGPNSLRPEFSRHLR